jgi:hypothetical protein
MLLKWLLDRPAEITQLADLVAMLEAGPNRLDFLAWLRLPVVLTSVAGIVLVFLLSRRLLGTAPALLALVLMSLNPFLLAHSRILHMDALLTIFMTLAWLALVAGTYSRRRRFLIGSGIAMALATLTKSPALLLAPLMVGWIFGHHWTRWPTRGTSPVGTRALDSISWTLKDLLWIGLPAVMTGLLVWPALWTAPLGTLERMWLFSRETGQSGHELGNFWLGKPVEDPGWLFYPVVVLLRSTPVALIGLLMSLVILLGHRRFVAGLISSLNLERPLKNHALWALWLFGLWFGLVMTLGAKKFDRYLLPTFPAIDLLAAWSWVVLGAWLWVNNGILSQQGRRTALLAGAASLVALQVWAALANGPTYLTAYNPLLGGTPTATRTILVGWGEGLAETAHFLNDRPESASEGTAAWYGHSVFGPFYRGRRYDLLYEVPSARSLYANDVDFVVTYINQEQRQLLDTSIQQLLDQPIKTETWQGVPLAKVYAWPKPFDHTTDQVLAAGRRLLGWSVGQHDAGAKGLPVTLYWDAETHDGQSTPPSPMTFRLVDKAGRVWSNTSDALDIHDFPIAKGWLDHQAIAQTLVLDVPPGLIPGEGYLVEATPPAGEPMVLGQAIIQATSLADVEDLPGQELRGEVLFAETIQLVDLKATTVADQVNVELLWAALDDVEPDAKFFVHLTDAEGQILAQHDATLAALPGEALSRWRPGELARHRVQLPLPPDPGTRYLFVGVYQPDSGQRLVATVNGTRLPDDRFSLKLEE